MSTEISERLPRCQPRRRPMPAAAWPPIGQSGPGRPRAVHRAGRDHIPWRSQNCGAPWRPASQRPVPPGGSTRQAGGHPRGDAGAPRQEVGNSARGRPQGRTAPAHGFDQGAPEALLKARLDIEIDVVQPRQHRFAGRNSPQKRTRSPIEWRAALLPGPRVAGSEDPELEIGAAPRIGPAPPVRCGCLCICAGSNRSGR